MKHGSSKPNRCGMRECFLATSVVTSMLVVACTPVTTATGAADSRNGGITPARLTLQIVPETTEVVAAQAVVISYELANSGAQAVYVCQWPGIAFGGGWSPADGETEGFGPGYPSARNLERKYFIELKPGEALLGRGVLEIFPNKAGEIHIWGVFRSGNVGGEYGLSGWKGEVTSEAVTILVPRE